MLLITTKVIPRKFLFFNIPDPPWRRPNLLLHFLYRLDYVRRQTRSRKNQPIPCRPQLKGINAQDFLGKTDMERVLIRQYENTDGSAIGPDRQPHKENFSQGVGGKRIGAGIRGIDLRGRPGGHGGFIAAYDIAGECEKQEKANPPVPDRAVQNTGRFRHYPQATPIVLILGREVG
ncbi:hypothetical protein ACWJKU_10675 [Methylocaldum sp. MU1018]